MTKNLAKALIAAHYHAILDENNTNPRGVEKNLLLAQRKLQFLQIVTPCCGGGILSDMRSGSSGKLTHCCASRTDATIGIDHRFTPRHGITCALRVVTQRLPVAEKKADPFVMDLPALMSACRYVMR